MPFGSLWLPVVVSAVAVWLASAIAHMVLPHHKADYKQLPNEEAVREAMRKGAPAPGMYVTPHCADPKQLKDPAVVKRFEEGPVAIAIVMKSGPPTMGKQLFQWLLFCLLVSFTAAYLARITLVPQAGGMTILRVTGTVALVGYAYAYLQDSIWKGIPWSNALRGVADSVVYAVLTGLAFQLLWPV